MTATINDPETPATPEALQDAEARLGVALPEDYRRFLLTANGGWPEPGVFEVTWRDPALARGHRSSEVGRFYSLGGGRRSTECMERLRQDGDRYPPGYLPIAADSGGDELLLGLTGEARGRVYYWVHDLPPEYDETDPANLGFVAESFEALLAALGEVDA